MYLGVGHTYVKRSKVKVTAGGRYHIFHTNESNFAQFHPVLVTDVFAFVDMLIRFWGQKIKGQGHSRE